MTPTRRDFIRDMTASAAACLTLGGATFAQSGQEKGKISPAPPKESGAKTPPSNPAAKPLKVLILGGTGFLGPQTVEPALRRGHTLTLFNRGKTHPGLFPDIEQIHGDRNTDIKLLAGRSWDVVIDNCGYFPRQVREATDVLKDAVKQYVFISSISVYKDNSKPGMDESTPVGRLEDETIEKITGESYGPLKALCEEAAEKAMPGRVTNIRPGLIVGPGDPSDRFTYWPVRIDRGGEVLAPGAPSDPIQIIDARDLGEWIVKLIEDGTFGVFNAIGPQKELTIGEMLKSCQAASSNKSTLTWADADFLEAQKVEPWSDMPVWVPPKGDMAGFERVSFAKAVAKGLKYRSIDDTVKATLAWFKTEPAERQAKLKAGIKPEREAEVLKAWHDKQSPSKTP